MYDEGQDDRDYWNVKYAEASCHEHGEDEMYYSHAEADWYCLACQPEEEYDDTQEANEEAYRYG